MRLLSGSLFLLLTFVHPLSAQRIGEQQPVRLIGTSTPLTLEFTDRDYLMILYSLHTDVPADLKENPEYGFSVFSHSSDAGSAGVRGAGAGFPPLSTGGPDAQLRRREQELARRVRETGGYRPPATKVAPHQVSARQFAFPAFGNVPDTTVSAVFVAGSYRADAYVDVADTGRISRTRIQGDADLVTLRIHPVVTSALARDPGEGDIGKVTLLYTHLVDEVGDDTTTVRGFFNAASVLPPDQGGNGDQLNLLFINPFNDPDVAEAVLAHEFQHLFSFHQHVLLRNGKPEEAWLNEGLSHVCEDLVDAHDVHNRQNIERFLADPSGTPLRGSVDIPGVRGAAYLFVRSLIQDYGMEILPRLVQTNNVGLRNVRQAAGDPITDIYVKFLSRLYFTGSGLNPSLEFTSPLLVDDATGARLFPRPREIAVTPQTSPRRGSVQPLSAAYIRLSYDESRTIWLQTDAEGSPGAVLVPILPADRDRVSIPTDFFTGITLDAPVDGPFLSYKAIPISGAVSDTLVSELEMVLQLEDYSTENRYVVPVRDEKFSHTFFFSHEQAGDYRLVVKTKRTDREDSDTAGTFGAFTVEEGPATAPIPVGYFMDIVFSSPIPVKARSGQAFRLSGTVSDPSLTVIKFSFWHDDIDRSLHFNAPVTDGQFRKTIFFTHGQTGVYQFAINRQRDDTSYSFPQDAFSPFVVVQGVGAALIPVDFFDEVRLQAPMPIEYRVGLPVSVEGEISDASVSQIEFEFYTPGGDTETPSETIDTRFTAQVVNGRFSTDVVFPPEQRVSDDYTLDVWLWRSGERTRGFRRFSPINILAALPAADFNRDGSVGFADFIAFAEAFGTSAADADFDVRFDLDGDGTVGFGDFVIFARAFGQ